MATIWVYSITSVFIVSLLSLVGVFTIFTEESRFRKWVYYLVALSVGALLGDVFIHIIPEILENSQNVVLTSTYILIGILLFFILEKFLHWRHSHGCENENCPTHPLGGVAPVGKIILVSDGLHNFIDGIIIGASYLASLPIGLATTLAVVMHEIPQELGNFGVLIHSGYDRNKALFYNFLSALFAVLGVLIPLFLFSAAEVLVSIVLPVAAGGFVYIAGSDLIPELHKEIAFKKSLGQFVFILLGILLMYAFLLLE
ncbi:ZIP family metal transporter [Candidatus Campbellbacteria bacterium CG11_big_fil_rev_8_21_14_0_20_44_21]|nr:MAG: ZIP family metal transporter [Candidatus Campbellbacteria bacterium CG11_big_fil_rev_8_21_14_0_20_44_21]